ncbi:MAG: hypothetical protein NZ551_02485 [Microscillaceae bacterium]|nr:hypothetical protein [Microscillaceae bacterium]MDW8460053.1 hypothetical protein [Cytophagales bacterium]
MLVISNRLLKGSVVWLLVLIISCKTSNSQNQGQVNTSNDKICNFWYHSFEETNENVKVYRPSTYNFPRARAREGLEIKPNGEVIAHRIGMADEPVQIAGKWKKIRENYYEIFLQNQEKIILEIQNLSAEKMIVKNQ